MHRSGLYPIALLAVPLTLALRGADSCSGCFRLS
jgi:hypothetical protein